MTTAKDSITTEPKPDLPAPHTTDPLNPPYGGPFKNLMVDASQAADLKQQVQAWPAWHLTPRQTCDLELLLNGGFNPLTGFMRQSDYERVCAEMRLGDGTLWPIPIVLDVPEAFAQQIGLGSEVVLRDDAGAVLALLTVEDMWRPDQRLEAAKVYGTTDPSHPSVRFLFEHIAPVYLGGKVRGLKLPQHHDFLPLRHTPEQLRSLLQRKGCARVIAFQTRNPMHRAHFEMTLRAVREYAAQLLIHPAVGMTRPGDVDHFCRTRCYQALLSRYPQDAAELSLLPLAMRLAGPREAVWHAIIRRNYGCSHLIIGRDHAGPGNGFYPAYAAQDLLREHASELGVIVIPFRKMVHVPTRKQYLPVDELPPGELSRDLSGTELRERLIHGLEIPDWFTFPEVAAELRKTYPARACQGFTVFFTGLPASGKSSLAKALWDKLLELGPRPVTLLDGDIVRKNLSSELGFSRAHRDLNIQRIGFVANEITKNGGIAICAPIAPYDQARKQVRRLISSRGGFLLVYVSTPLAFCEQHDHKGLYAKARAGNLPGFTGVTDPYETPTDAELVVNAAEVNVEEACQRIVNYLRDAGYLQPASGEKDATASVEQAPDSGTLNNSVALCEVARELSASGKHRRSFADRLSRVFWYLDPEKLCAEVSRRTSLQDFGDPPLAPALPILLNSFEREAGLRPLGRYLMRVHVRDLLQNRLRLANAWQRKRAAMDHERLRPPVFIVGIPRSGNTFLHELLAALPDNRAPQVWEVMFPLAAGGDEPNARERSIRKTEACLWWFRRLAPRADSVYPMRATTPHECVAIQSYTFLSEEFVSTCRIPSYETFLRASDLTPVYAWEKRFLQYLQLGLPPQRWILKSPDHVYGLEALFSIFPDAVLVQTHRNPIEVLKSSADLTQVLQNLYGRAADPQETLCRETKTLAQNTDRFVQFRERHPELTGRIVDIRYSDLIAHPLQAVQAVYAQLDTTLSESDCERVRQLASQRSQYRGPRASREPFSLRFDAETELRRFERYCLRFGLPFRGVE